MRISPKSLQIFQYKKPVGTSILMIMFDSPNKSQYLMLQHALKLCSTMVLSLYSIKFTKKNVFITAEMPNAVENWYLHRLIMAWLPIVAYFYNITKTVEKSKVPSMIEHNYHRKNLMLMSNPYLLMLKVLWKVVVKFGKNYLRKPGMNQEWICVTFMPLKENNLFAV